MQARMTNRITQVFVLLLLGLLPAHYAAAQVQTATITSPATLDEADLQGAALTVTLTNTEYETPLTADQFTLTLTGGATGISVGSVNRDSPTAATLTLAYGGTGVDADTTIAVTVADAAHTGAGDLITATTVTVTAVVENNNADLSALALSAGMLTPTFDAATTSYTAMVANSVSSLTLTPTAADAGATITVNGTAVTSGMASGSITLNVGSNLILVEVTAADGSTMTYAVTVARMVIPGGNGAELSSASVLTEANLDGATLSVGLGGTSFFVAAGSLNAAQFTLSTTVPGVTVSAVSRVGGFVADLTLAYDGTDFDVDAPLIVTITAAALTGTEDLNTNALTVTAVVESNNADLSALTLSAGTLTPDFDTATTSYTAMVDNSVSSLTLTPTVANAFATITVASEAVASGVASGSVDLAEGPNAIAVEVTATDGSTTQTYTVTVTRAAAVGVASATFVTNPDPLTEANLDGATVTVTLMNTEYVEAGSLSVDHFLLDILVSGVTVMSVSRTDATNAVLTLAYAGADFDTDDTFFVDIVAAAHTGTDALTTGASNVPVTAVMESINANLSALLLSEGVLTPGFAAATLTYTAMVGNSVSSLTLMPTAADAGATITVDGVAATSGAASEPVALAEGDNPIDVVVTAEDGPPATLTYTVTVTRSAAPTAAISATVPDSLTEANLDGATLTVTLTGTTYLDSLPANPVTLNTAATTAGVTVMTAVRASATEATLTLAHDGTDFDTDLDIIVTVAAAAHTGTGDLDTGTVTVAAVDESDVATLSALTLSGGATLTPTFDAGIFTYTADVDNSVANIMVTPTATDDGATIEVQGTAVTSGSASTAITLTAGMATDIDVLVTAEDGSTTRTYNLAVTRAAAADVPGDGSTTVRLMVPGTLADAIETAPDQDVFLVALVSGGAYQFNAERITGDLDTSLGLYPPGHADFGSADCHNSTGVLTGNDDFGAFVFSDSQITHTATQTGDHLLCVDSVGEGGLLGNTSGEYRLTAAVTSEPPAADDATLSALTLSGGATLTPDFAAGTLTYTADVANSVADIMVTPTATVAGATITVNGDAVTSGSASTAITLTAGMATDIDVLVTATDGSTTQTYNLAVTRAAADVPNDGSTTVRLPVPGTLTDDINPVNDVDVFLVALVSGGTYQFDAVGTGGGFSLDTTIALFPPGQAVNVSTSCSVAAGALVSNDDFGGDVNSRITHVATQTGDHLLCVDGLVLSIGEYRLTAAVTSEPPAADDATLSALTLSGGATLTPDFDAATTSYTAMVGNSVSSLMVTPTVANAGATITVAGTAVASGMASGRVDLVAGTNAIAVEVTATDGSTTQTYTVTVTRAVASGGAGSARILATNPATLTEANLNGTTVTVTLLNTEYVGAGSLQAGQFTPTGTVSGVTVMSVSRTDATNAVLTLAYDGTDFDTDSFISLTILAAAHTGIGGNITVRIGATGNVVSLPVTAVVENNNANLSALTLSAGMLTPTFVSATTSYTAIVDNSVSSLTLTPTVANAFATITVAGTAVASGMASGSVDLDEGPNAIDVVVTATDGSTTQTYTVTVTRAAPGAASSVATLSGLTLSGGATLNPVFAPATLSYAADVAASVVDIMVTPTATDAAATIAVNGTAVNSGAASTAIALTAGGATPITVLVTAEDGSTTQTYNLAVTRRDPDIISSVVATGPSEITVTFSAPVSIVPSGDPNFAGSALNLAHYSLNGAFLERASHAPDTTVSANAAGTALVFTLSEAGNPIDLSPAPGDYLGIRPGGRGGVTNIDPASGNARVLGFGGPSQRVPWPLPDAGNAKLSALTLSGGATLTPTFDTGTFAYTADVAGGVADIMVTPTVTISGATITVQGNAVNSGAASTAIALTAGAATDVAVVITATDGSTTQTYRIAVTRAAGASPAARISAINPVGGGSLSEEGLDGSTVLVTLSNTDFVASTSVIENDANYRVNGLTGLTISAVSFLPASSGVFARVIIEFAYDGTDFDADTEFTVTVLDAVHTGTGDLTTGTETATATDETSRLSALSLSEGALDPVFNAGTFAYAASVANSIDGLTVTPAAAAGTTITVDSTPVNSGAASAELALTVGTNTITVAVTTPRADAQDYTLTVTREMALSFGGASTGGVTEDAPTDTATGTLDVTNPNPSGGTEVVAQTDTDGTYGMFTIVAASGAWTYTLDNANAATNALAASETVTDVFPVVAAADPGATTDVTITITGANDAPTADAGPPQAVALSATVTLDGSASADPDTGADPANADAIDTYTWEQDSGTNVTLDDAAVVSPTFTAPNSAGDLVFSLLVNDGDADSAPDTVTITVTADPAATISATTPATLTEDMLNGATLTVTLVNTTYAPTPVANQFTLAGVTGVTVSGVTRAGNTEATLTLAFDRAANDFDANASLTVTVLEAAHTGTGDLPTAPATVEAIDESDVATLAGLTLSGGASLNEAFAPATLSYTADVANDVTDIMVTPTATDATGATITVNGDAVNSGAASIAIALTAGGATPIPVVVTAEDGVATQTYTLTVTRAAAPAPAAAISASIPASLTEANLDNATLTVTLTGTTYQSPLPVGSVTLNAAATAAGVTVMTAVRDTATAATVTLDYDDTDFDADLDIIVTVAAAAHAGTGNLPTAARTVTAIVETSRLSALSLSEGMLTPPFNVGTFVYTASVVNSINGLTVTPAAAVGTTITVDSTPVNSGEASAEITLNPGANTITVAVTAPRATAQTYTLTVTREQALTFGGTGTTGSVTEDAATTTATGTLTVTNPNPSGSTEVVAQTDTNGTYGMFSIVAASGAWTYTLNNNASATNALAEGATVNDVFTVAAAADPGATTDVTITITGANDAPTAAITAPTGSPQVQFGTAVTLTGSGTDPDAGDSLAYAWTTNPPNTGSFADATVASTTWTAPASGTGPVTLSLTVTDDATTPLSGTAQVTVNPVTEPIVITGANTGSVVEDATATASGTLTLSNPGGGTDFVARTDVIGTYGTFSIVADTGDWTYTLNNADADTNALAAGSTADDVFTVAAAADPTVTEVVTITITGANDAPVAVISAPPANRTVSHGGQLAVVGTGTDPDAGETASLSYTWSTTPASTGSFADSTAASTTWTAPATGASVILNLLVSDATASATATVTITLVAATANIDGNTEVNHLDGLVMYLSLNPVFNSLRSTERFRNELMGHLTTSAVGTTRELVDNAEAWRTATVAGSDVDGVGGVTHLDGLVIYLSLNPVFNSLRSTERFRNELMGHLTTTEVATTQGLVDNANLLTTP